jgi:hypothetical protein
LCEINCALNRCSIFGFASIIEKKAERGDSSACHHHKEQAQNKSGFDQSIIALQQCSSSHKSQQCTSHAEHIAALPLTRSAACTPHLSDQHIANNLFHGIAFFKPPGEAIANIPDRPPPKLKTIFVLRI